MNKRGHNRQIRISIPLQFKNCILHGDMKYSPDYARTEN